MVFGFSLALVKQYLVMSIRLYKKTPIVPNLALLEFLFTNNLGYSYSLTSDCWKEYKFFTESDNRTLSFFNIHN